MARRKKDDLKMKLDEMIAKDEAKVKAENETFAALTAEVCEKLELFELLEYVNQLTKDSKLAKNKLEKGKVLLESASARFNLTVDECIMLAIVIEKTGTVEYDDMSFHFDCSNVKTMMMKKYLDSLVRKRWLNYVDSFRDEGYVVRSEPLDALFRNEVYNCKEISNLSAEEFLDRANKVCRERYNDDCTEDVFRAELFAMIDYNPEIPFVATLKGMRLNDNEMLVSVAMLCALYKNGNSAFSLNSLRRFIPRFAVCLDTKDTELFKQGMVEYVCENGVANTKQIQFTNKFQHKLADGIKLCKKSGVNGNDIIHSKDIKSKALYYNQQEQKQVETLNHLLSTEQLSKIAERMNEKGFGNCFSCLFYGAPGTGKTETVLQLARMTGRDIMQVDMSELRDKYVGESEKNVKNIFERYKTICKDSERTPILLLNEADAIIGKRMTGNLDSVDKMENAIQNIILQEMETFHGILIATTNLTANMDPAFDRRFLYKVEFKNPSYEAKVSIWHSVLPEVSDELISQLATNFDLSGGQIQNVARKYTINSILNGSDPTYEDMREFCKGELLQRKAATSHIGFC